MSGALRDAWIPWRPFLEPVLDAYAGRFLVETFNALPLFHALGQPLMVGASRKRMIGALSNEAEAHQRLGGSLAIAVTAMDAGVQLIRVHDVAETVQARNVWRGLRDAALTDFSGLPA